METTKEILTELKGIAPFLGSAGISRVPYALPAEYFDDFADILMNRIRLEDAGFGKAVSSIRKNTEISAQEEISGISPLLAGLKNKNPYQAPEGYFDGMKAKIPESIPVKVIEISAPAYSKSGANHTRQISIPMRMVRYAAAACIVGLISIGAFYIIAHHQVIDPITGLTTISDQDMAIYLDDDDIHWTPGVSLSPEMVSVEFSDNDIHELLSSVPDKELEQYSSLLPKEKRSVN